MNLQERLSARQAVNDATDYETEQAAITRACVVDVLPSPGNGADLHPQGFGPDTDIESWTDYINVCKALGAAWDKGARRYVINRKDSRRVVDALAVAGFVVAVHPSCLG